jgi:hypothetical protein
MKIYIKNKVFIRCRMAIKSELEKIEIHYRTIDLGVHHNDIPTLTQ